MFDNAQLRLAMANVTLCDVGINAGADMQCRRITAGDFFECQNSTNASIASPASGSKRIFCDSVAGALYSKDSSGVTRLLEKNNTISRLVLWRSDAAAAVALQGLNLAAARAELGSSTTGANSRQNVTAGMVGKVVTCAISVTIVATVAGTIRVSIRDTASQAANVLCVITFSAASITTITRYNNTHWLPTPTWLTTAGDAGKVIACYVEGGNAAADFVFNECSLLWKG